MKYLKYARFSLLLLVVLLGGCGEEAAIDNNTGPNRTCGPGTVLTALFECVPDGSSLCADGTVEVDGKCVAGAEACGEETRWEDGKCVPDTGAPPCGEGTTFSEDTARCMPDVVCGAGTTAVGGQCLSDAEVLVADIDAREADEENDPAFGGTAQALTMPAAGDSYLLLGTISAPVDKNADGWLDQDVDVYRFEAQHSDFVRVHLRQLGVGSFGFEVRGPNGYYREGARNEAGPSRALLLPADGSYEIRVQPQATMFEPDAGPVGSEDHRYLLILENVGGLELEKAEIVDTTVSQSFRASFQKPENQLARLLHPAQAAIRLEVESGGEASVTEPVLMLVDAQGKVVHEYVAGQVQHLMRASEEHSRFLYVDYVQANTLDSPVVVGTEVLETTSFPTAIRAGQSASLAAAGQMLPNTARYFTFELDARTASGTAVPQGMVVNFLLNRTNNRGAELTVYTPDSQIVTSSIENRVLFYAEKPGVYLVELKNWDELNSLNYSNLNVVTYVPVNLGDLDTGTKNKQTSSFSVPSGDVQFFTYEAVEPLVSSIKAVPALGKEPTWMELSGIDMRPRAQVDGTSFVIDRHVILSPSRRVGSLYNDGSQNASGLLELTAVGVPQAESEPNNTRLEANVLLVEDDKAPAPVHGSVKGSDVDYFKFRLNKRALVGFEAKVVSGAMDLKVQLLNSEGNLIELGARRGDGIKSGAVLQADTDYYVSVAASASGARTEYAMFSSVITTDAVLEKEPNNQASQATKLAADAVEMVGTLGGYNDVDWFELSLGQARWVKPVWRTAAGFGATQEYAAVTFYGADGTTVLDFETMVYLPAGKSFVRVSTPQSMETGNTYHLGLEAVNFESLGGLSVGGTLGRRGAGFGVNNDLSGYSFTLDEDLQLDESEAVFVWASAQLTVFDADGNALFVARDSGQVFGSAAEPSMYVRALEAGTYYLAVKREFASDHDLLIGKIVHREELEITGANSNNTFDTAEVLGTLVSGEAVYVQGYVSEHDPLDYFEIEVPGQVGDPERSVSIEMFRLGESVGDIGLGLQSATDHPLDDANMTPQIITRDLAPGRYIVRAWFFDDVGFNSGDYLLRILMD